MKIAVMGSGGVGGYFGARLAKGGADVHFVARGAHLAAMRESGIAIEGGPDPIHVPKVSATDAPQEIGVADLVLFAVKLWDTESALEMIRPMVGANTAIVSFQNGVLKDEYLGAAYDPRQIMGGVTYVATTIDRPGVIRQTGTMQRLVFGEFNGVSSRPPEPAASTPRSAPTSAARSGRSSSSWSASRARPPPCARPSARSARTRRRAPSSATLCARWWQSGARTGSASTPSLPTSGSPTPTAFPPR
jgi:2-dehydropantoate 2-reductase